MKRSAQLGYSNLHSEVYYGKANRERKALTIVSILHDYLGDRLQCSRVLDVGASTGYIDNILADHVEHLDGIDIDHEAVVFAKKSFKKNNLKFNEGDALNLEYQNESFDVVVCNHVYEHVVDDKKLMEEIFRILKNDGICFFTAGNRINFIEPHHKLPLLSVMPRAFSHFYMRIMGKGNFYHEKHRTLWGLRALTKSYQCKDYTREVVFNPEYYKLEYMVKQGSMKQKIAKILCSYLYCICPTYIWVLRKRF